MHIEIFKAFDKGICKAHIHKLDITVSAFYEIGRVIHINKRFSRYYQVNITLNNYKYIGIDKHSLLEALLKCYMKMLVDGNTLLVAGVLSISGANEFRQSERRFPSGLYGYFTTIYSLEKIIDTRLVHIMDDSVELISSCRIVEK